MFGKILLLTFVWMRHTASSVCRLVWARMPALQSELPVPFRGVIRSVVRHQKLKASTKQDFVHTGSLCLWGRQIYARKHWENRCRLILRGYARLPVQHLHGAIHLFLTKGGNGRDILNRAYLVVGVLNGHQSGLPFQSPQQSRQIYFPFFADRQRIYSYSAIF